MLLHTQNIFNNYLKHEMLLIQFFVIITFSGSMSWN